MSNIYLRDTTLLVHALLDLGAAAKELEERTYPPIRLPRPKIFYFTKEVRWPYIFDDDGTVEFDAVHAADWGEMSLNNISDINETAAECLRRCGGTSGAVLRVLRNIQAATAWCRARAEGRRRAVQEILRQTKKASEILDAEFALLSLSSFKKRR